MGLGEEAMDSVVEERGLVEAVRDSEVVETVAF